MGCLKKENILSRRSSTIGLQKLSPTILPVMASTKLHEMNYLLTNLHKFNRVLQKDSSRKIEVSLAEVKSLKENVPSTDFHNVNASGAEEVIALHSCVEKILLFYLGFIFYRLCRNIVVVTKALYFI